MMLDGVSALAFEMHAGKGVFALLVGSGISRSAKIPTGWEITIDLVKTVAALRGADPGPDPAAWYASTFGREPDYSELLEQASTPTLRHLTVRPYIEPSAQERERGEKQPTKAHHAIAKLIADGYVRLVLTTNFDRLLEQALDDAGVRPSVIASADHIAGAMPLIHAGPTIVKVHGDYLDTRIRNTTTELLSYEAELNALLDRVFDEFGLVVCGWSADWDVALKAAIDRAPSRRFPMYWAARGTPGAAAQGLISRRGGRLLSIAGADEFFEDLAERVAAVERVKQPHPLSVELAVAMLKEYLPEPRHAIRLHDFLGAEVERLIQRLNLLHPEVYEWTPEIFAREAELLVAATVPILPLAYYSGLWCGDHQVRPWLDLVVLLGKRRKGFSGFSALIDLRALPASLVLYAFALGAIVGRHYAHAGKVIGAVADVGRGDKALGDVLSIAHLVDQAQARFRSLPRYSARLLAGSELVADVLRPIARHELRDDEAFDSAFAKLELALAFGCAERIWKPSGSSTFFAPTGRHHGNYRAYQPILRAWRDDYSHRSSQSELSQLAALHHAPEFDQIEQHLTLPL